MEGGAKLEPTVTHDAGCYEQFEVTLPQHVLRENTFGFESAAPQVAGAPLAPRRCTQNTCGGIEQCSTPLGAPN